jgi:cytochrome c oxidase assembly protein subunit 15
MLHRFAKVLAGCTVILILAGSLVTSHDAGLSVPDWPTSYGWNMFTFPPSMWVANIRYEHVHRLVASTVGLLTIVLAVWTWIADPRRWLKWFAVAALGAVIAQGILGGLTVLFFLPAPVSTAHAGLAEIFFCMTVAVALFTSPTWIHGGGAVDDRQLRLLATTTTILIYVQILIGATMRHTDAGLAIPDFPLMFGGIVPDHWDPKIAVHFAHRVGAVVVAAAAVTTAIYAWRHYTDRAELAQPALVLVLLIAVQMTLGALTVITRRDVWINSIHVVGGALVLTTSLVITLRSWRVRFGAREVRLKPDTTGITVTHATTGIGSVRLQPDPVTRGNEVRLKPDATRGSAPLQPDQRSIP